MSVQSDNMDNTILYKLGAIEAQIREQGNNYSTQFARLEQRIEEAVKKPMGEIARIEGEHKVAIAKMQVEIDALEKKVNFLENWRLALFTKLGFVVSGVSVFWVVFGKPIETAVQRIL